MQPQKICSLLTTLKFLPSLPAVRYTTSVPLLPVFCYPLAFRCYQMSFQVMKSRQAISLCQTDLENPIRSFCTSSLILQFACWLLIVLFWIFLAGKKKRKVMLVPVDKYLNNGRIREMGLCTGSVFAFWRVYNEKLHKCTCWLCQSVGFWLSQWCSWNLRPSGTECGPASRLSGSGRFETVQRCHIQKIDKAN
jgi:hypothetical protein